VRDCDRVQQSQGISNWIAHENDASVEVLLEQGFKRRHLDRLGIPRPQLRVDVAAMARPVRLRDALFGEADPLGGRRPLLNVAFHDAAHAAFGACGPGLEGRHSLSNAFSVNYLPHELVMLLLLLAHGLDDARDVEPLEHAILTRVEALTRQQSMGYGCP